MGIARQARELDPDEIYSALTTAVVEFRRTLAAVLAATEASTAATQRTGDAVRELIRAVTDDEDA